MWIGSLIGLLRRGNPWLQPGEETPLLLSGGVGGRG
jgi:hypothetical protein